MDGWSDPHIEQWKNDIPIGQWRNHHLKDESSTASLNNEKAFLGVLVTK